MFVRQYIGLVISSTAIENIASMQELNTHTRSDSGPAGWLLLDKTRSRVHPTTTATPSPISRGLSWDQATWAVELTLITLV